MTAPTSNFIVCYVVLCYGKLYINAISIHSIQYEYAIMQYHGCRLWRNSVEAINISDWDDNCFQWLASNYTNPLYHFQNGRHMAKGRLQHCKHELRRTQRNTIQAAPFHTWNKAEPRRFSNYCYHFSAQPVPNRATYGGHLLEKKNHLHLFSFYLYLTLSGLNFPQVCIPTNCICIIFQ